MTGKICASGSRTAKGRARPWPSPTAAPSPIPSAAAARSSSRVRSSTASSSANGTRWSPSARRSSPPPRMTSSLGSAALALAFVALLAAAALALVGRDGDARWVLASRRAVYAALALLTLCVVLIEIAFAGDDFSFNIVQQHSSIETPPFYKLAAMWSSQEGSLLLWAWVLSIASSLALYATRNRLRELVPYATAVLAGVASFFTGLMLFAGGVNPFATLDSPPPDG